MARKLIFDDSRYAAFVERYHADPLRFAVEVCGMVPSEDQQRLLEGMTDPTAKVSVVSGTGTGKTMAFARIALWHLLCHPLAEYDGKVEIGSNTYIGGPKVQTVADGVWKELQDSKIAIKSGPVAWIADYFTITKTRVYMDGFEEQWFISQIAMQKGASVGVAGKHRYWQLIIVDEACGVPDGHFDVIDGTQTQGGNRTLMASQGARNAGRFYDSHHSMAMANGGSWNSLCFSSENSPFVTKKWIKEREIETGGRDTPEFQIRVLGRFPENSDKYLLGKAAIEKRIGAPWVVEPDMPFGNVLVVDVAAGVYRDKTVCSHFRVTGNGSRGDADARRADLVAVPVFTNSLDWQGVARQVIDYAATLSNCTIVVDVGGQGVQFARMLENGGAGNVIHCNWGNPCFRKKNKERFVNLRAQCSVHAAEAVKDGRLSLSPAYKKELLDQGSRIPFFFDDRTRWKIMSKEDMLAEGIKSPDLWDTVCMVFLEMATYIESDGTDGFGGTTQRQAAIADAEASIAALLGDVASAAKVLLQRIQRWLPGKLCLRDGRNDNIVTAHKTNASIGLVFS